MPYIMAITEQNSPERVAARKLVCINAPESCPIKPEILKNGDSDKLFVLKDGLNETKMCCLVTNNPLCKKCPFIYGVATLTPEEVDELSN